METPLDLLVAAKARAKAASLSYCGALTPKEAYEVWQRVPNAKLVDVRTQAERDWVGRIPGAIEIEWMTYPGNISNIHFLDEIKAKIPLQSLVMLLCRSGARSHRAACLLGESGYAECFNVLEGFEGDLNENGHRGFLGGWRNAGLPWKS